MNPLESLFGENAGILHDRDLQALLLANVLPPLGSGLLSPILDSLIGPFGTSPADVGLLISVFTAPAILMTPVAGVLADHYGRKPVLTAALLLFGVAGSAIAFTTDFRVALGLRLLQGVAFGGLTPVIITCIGDIYDATEEATAQGVRFTGSGFVLTVFPLASGALVVVAWQYPFLLYLMSLPAAAAVHRWLDEPTGGGSGAAARTDGGTARARLRGLFGLLRQRRVSAMVIARSLPNAVWIGFITYNSIVVVRVLGGTPTQAGLVVAVGSVSLAAAASQAGRLTDLFDSRRNLLLAANVCLGAGFAVFLVAPSLAVAGAGIVLAGVGFGVTMSLYRSIITGLATESLRGGLVSLAESLGRVSATVTPLLMGAGIALLAPRVGTAPAVQATGLAVAVAGSAGGVVCLLVVSASPPIDHS